MGHAKKLMGLAAAFAVTGLNATGNWEQFHGTSGNNGRAEKGPDLRVYDTPRFASALDGVFVDDWMGPSASSPVVADGRVFCYTAGEVEVDGWVYNDVGPGYVAAFDEGTGARLWTAEVEHGEGSSCSSPSAGGGRVFIASADKLYCLDAATGAGIWTNTLDNVVVNASVTIAADLGICFLHSWGTGGGAHLYAFNVADGAEAWQPKPWGGSPGQGNVAYNPSARLLYTTRYNGMGFSLIEAFNAADGSAAWTSDPFNGRVFGGIAFDAALNWVVASGEIGSGGTMGEVMVCDASDGSTVSQTGVGFAPGGNHTPAIGADGTIYVCGGDWAFGLHGVWDSFVCAINGADGTKKWGEDYYGNWNVSCVVAQDIGDGTGAVYVPNAFEFGFGDAGYSMLDAASGAVLATVDTWGGGGALANGNLYFINADAKLVAFGPRVHIIEVDVGANGSVSPSNRQAVAEGGSVTFTFEGFVADVVVDGVSVGAVSSYTFENVTESKSVTVAFNDGPPPPVRMVGVPFSMQIEADDAFKPARFSAVKLPPGLKIDAATGVISGVPTKSGVYAPVIKITSVANSKNSTSMEKVIAIEALPLNAQGVFNGSIRDNNAALRGTFTATISASGKFTAKAVTTAGTWSFSAPSFADKRGDVFIINAATAKGQTLALELDASAPWNAFQMAGGLNGVYDARAQRNLLPNQNYADHNAALNALAANLGYHTLALSGTVVAGGTGDANNIPEGHGYLTLSVNDKGSVKFSGKLADGAAVSGSTALLMFPGGNDALCFRPLYRSRGFFAGGLRMDADGWIAGGADWVYPGKSPAAKTPAIEDRFAMDIVANGARYNTLSSLASHYAGLQFFAGANALAGIVDNGKGALASSDKAAATFSANAKTGVFSGRFKVVHGITGKLVSVASQGVLVKAPDGNDFGAGYYLVSETSKINNVNYTIKRSFPVSVE